MNSLISKRAIQFIKVSILSLILAPLAQAWEVDFSRRAQELEKNPSFRSPQRGPASVVTPQIPTGASEAGFFRKAFEAVEPAQEVVILNTESGFVPDTVRLKKDGRYRVHVVNVNQSEKNTSFVMDAFSEHHATHFGQIKTFEVTPKVDGVFSFVSPETSAQGKLIIYSAGDSRMPASR